MSIIVLDLEATCWSKDEDPELSERQRTESEIIEIGAIKLDPHSLTQIGEFARFVRPANHPTLSDFCRTLTTITQQDIDDAEPFADVFAAFVAWMGGQTLDATLVSWGRYDHNQLCRECERAGMPRPGWHPINAKEEFSDWVRWQHNQKRRFGLGHAISFLGWRFEGTPHRGIDDARNLARIFTHVRSPEHMSPRAAQLAQMLRERHPEPTHLGHLKKRYGTTKSWFAQGCKELTRLGFIETLDAGRGVRLLRDTSTLD